MKISKKIISLALASAMTMSMTLPGLAVSPENLSKKHKGILVMGDKAFTYDYAGRDNNQQEIDKAFFAAGSKLYYFDYNGNWYDMDDNKVDVYDIAGDIKYLDGELLEEEVTIVKIAKPADIEITAGEEVVLPEMVTVTYSDGSEKEVAVKWNVEGKDFSVAGMYDIIGQVEGTEKVALITVNVKAVEEEPQEPEVPEVATIVEIAKPADIEITAGEEVVLPEMVTATYSDGSEKEVAVEWNVEGKDFSVAGIYDIVGTVEGTEKVALITINVKAVEEEPEEITVVNAVALDGTTVKVTFSNEEEMEFKVDALKEGNNTVTVTYNGTEYTVDVVFKSAVEEVRFDNYRQFRVVFNTVVDRHTAEDPANYYFEIVEGGVNEDAFGAAPDLGKYNMLKAIENAHPNWWNKNNANIVAEEEDGKTVVTIRLPEDARFTNVFDDEEGIDAEKTLTVKLTKDKVKNLVKNTNVIVNVRNVKNAEGKRTIDTSSLEMKILDEEAPKLNQVGRYRDSEPEYELDDVIEVYSDGSDKIQLRYNEPVFDAHDLGALNIQRDVQVYVNGKFAGSSKKNSLGNKVVFTMDGGATYDNASTVTLDPKEIAEAAVDKDGNQAKESFKDGDELEITLVGVTDLAGNIQVPSEVKVKVKVVDKNATEDNTQEEVEVVPVVTGIEQVADNIFKVYFNRADVTGVFHIDNADGEGGELKVNIPVAKKYERRIEGQDEPECIYSSYVVVDAVDVDVNENHDKKNVADDNILAYDGQTQLDRTIRITDIWSINKGSYSLRGENVKKENFTIVKDTLAPTVVNKYVYKHQEADAAKLKLKVNDMLPETWAKDYSNPVKALIYDYNHNLTDDIDRNAVVAFGQDDELTDNAQYLPIKVSYVDKKGITHSALLSNKNLPNNKKPGGAVEKPISYSIENGLLTLDLQGYHSLLEDGKLVLGTTYKVELEKGFFADPELEDINNDVDQTESNDFLTKVDFAGAQVPTDNLEKVAKGANPALAAVKMDVLHVSEARALKAGAFVGKGYSSEAQVATFEILEKPEPEEEVPEIFVPQTSKDLIKYDKDSNEISIEFKGSIDPATLMSAENYVINGKTLASYGTKDSDIKFVQDKDDAGKVTNQYAVFTVPQDSISRDGDAQIIVKGVKNEYGATMVAVTADIALLDNTRPTIKNAVKQGDYQIVLTFDEPVEFRENANQFTAAKNFKLFIGGVEMKGSVLEAKLVGGERKVTLQLGVNLTKTEGEIEIEIVADDSNNLNIIDQAKHKNPIRLNEKVVVKR